MIDIERIRTLAAFIRGQAMLTDKHPHKPGPGDVHLNFEEALRCAQSLESEVRYREALMMPGDNFRDLLRFVEGEWMDASEAVAMGGGTGSHAHEVLAASPPLQVACARVDQWERLAALVREKIDGKPGP